MVRANNSRTNTSNFDIESKLSEIQIIEGDIPLRIMTKSISELDTEKRDDFDYYEPIEELKEYEESMLYPLEEVLDFLNESRDPINDDKASFKYVEISSIDTLTGKISTDYTEIPCEEGLIPSRARKVIHKRDILISTVRPTRKAIAIVDEQLENEICSTGFAVTRTKDGIDSNYIQYILRSDLVGKQFLKYASGSSYPAIIEKHIKMTIVPIPDEDTQKKIGDEWQALSDYLGDIQNKLRSESQIFNAKTIASIKDAEPAIIKKEQSNLAEF